DAADVESPLKEDELQVLRAQYEKEGEYVGLQTKFNYAWGLIKSLSRQDQQEGVRLLSDIFRSSRERRRECLYYLALGNYKLGNYAEARRYNELLLELEPANLQAGSLKGLIDEKVAKDGLVGAAIVGGIAVAAGLVGTLLLKGNPPPTHLSFQPIPHYTSATMSTNQTTPGHRDMMFCHECADEWYRDQHGLSCPECGSDFTEIIEDDHDPRDAARQGDDNDLMPDMEEPPLHILENLPQNLSHNPWQNDDPEEGDISNFRFSQTAPGRYNVQATLTRSVSPQQMITGTAPGPIGGFMQMLTNLARVSGQPPSQQRAQGQGRGEGLSGQTDGQSHSAYEEARSQNEGGDSSLPRSGRFTYHGGARLYPRDANNPEPRMEPVDDISNVMAGFFAAFGAPPGSMNDHLQGGLRGAQRGQPNLDQNPHMVGNPLLQMLSTVGLIPGGGQMGDFVYSQEGLDRIVSQLMEQTATSNAPGPAPQDEIDSLTRKRVTEDMLGDEHRAECSICMDEVNIGEEVTVLPCKHWFHHPCVSAWLKEHDTCPHCRKGISKHEGESNDSTSSSSGQAASASQSRQMPGAFDASDTTPSGSPANANSSSEGGGVGDRIRRGWFGPTS
ncbi:hypothetical protein P153DRAFT_294879, partial [Dothidotthia symphoricarpi CBS 119687]